MAQIKSISVLKTAIMTSIVFFVISIEKVFQSFISIMLTGISVYEYSELLKHTGQEKVMTLIYSLPLAYAVMGFIFGAVICFIYNCIAKYFGGIEIEIEE